MQGTGRSFYWSQWVLDWSRHFIYSVVWLQWKKHIKETQSPWVSVQDVGQPIPNDFCKAYSKFLLLFDRAAIKEVIIPSVIGTVTPPQVQRSVLGPSLQEEYWTASREEHQSWVKGLEDKTWGTAEETEDVQPAGGQGETPSHCVTAWKEGTARWVSVSVSLSGDKAIGHEETD